MEEQKSACTEVFYGRTEVRKHRGVLQYCRSEHAKEWFRAGMRRASAEVFYSSPGVRRYMAVVSGRHGGGPK